MSGIARQLCNVYLLAVLVCADWVFDDSLPTIWSIDGDCPEPQPVANTYRETRDSVLNYTCRQETIHSDGDLQRTCDVSTSVLLGTAPTCTFDCGDPMTWDGATIQSSTGTSLGDSVTYSCRDYGNRNTRTSSCTEEGWSFSYLFCRDSSTNLGQGQTITYPDDQGSTDADGCVVVIQEGDELPWIGLKWNDGQMIDFQSAIVTEATSISDRWSQQFYLRLYRQDQLVVTYDVRNRQSPARVSLNSPVAVDEIRFYTRTGQIGICDIQAFGQLHVDQCPKLIPPHKTYLVSYNPVYSGLARYACLSGFMYIGGYTDKKCSLDRSWEAEGRAFMECTGRPDIAWNSAYTLTTTGSRPQTLTSGYLQHDDPTVSSLVTFPDTVTQATLSLNLSLPYIVERVTLTVTGGTPSNVRALTESPTSVTCAEDTDYAYLDSHTFLCGQQPVVTQISIDIAASEAQTLDAVAITELNVLGLSTSEGVTECYMEDYGRDYKGHVNITVQGYDCLYWTDVRDLYGLQDSQFPDATMADAKNYCRSPEGRNVNGPYCYTVHGGRFCDVPSCAKICSYTRYGDDYKGRLATTENGNQCIDWTSSGLPFTRTSDFPGADNAHNYCRNPANSQTQPWCYMSSSPPLAEQCIVPQCPTTTTYGRTQLPFYQVKEMSQRYHLLRCFSQPGYVDDWVEATPGWLEQFCADSGPDGVDFLICVLQATPSTAPQWSLAEFTCVLENPHTDSTTVPTTEEPTTELSATADEDQTTNPSVATELNPSTQTVTNADATVESAKGTAETVTNAQETTDTVTNVDVTSDIVTNVDATTETISIAYVTTETVTNADVISNTVTNTDVTTETVTNMDVTTDTVANVDVTTDTVANVDVTTDTVANVDVTTDTVANVDVTTDTVANVDVTTDTVANVDVTTDTVANVDVTTDTVANVDVTTDTVANVDVTTDTVANVDVTSDTVTNADVTSDTVTNADVTSDTVTNADVTSDVAANADVTSDTVTNAGVTSDVAANADVTSDTVTNADVTSDVAANAGVTSDTVTNADVTSNTVTRPDVTTEAVTDVDVTSDTVTNWDRTSDAVTNVDVTSDTVTNVDVTTKTINNAYVTTETVTIADVTSNTVINADVTTEALTDADVTFDTVTNSDITSDAATNAVVTSDTVTNADVTTVNVTNAIVISNTVTNADVTSDTVTNVDVTAEAVTDADVTTEAVTSADVTSDTVTNADVVTEPTAYAGLTTEAITIADVTTETISNAYVTTETVTNADVTSNTVTSADVTSDTVTNADVVTEPTAYADLTTETVTIADVTSESLPSTAISNATLTIADFSRNAILNTGTTTDIVTSAITDFVTSEDASAETVTDTDAIAQHITAFTAATSTIVQSSTTSTSSPTTNQPQPPASAGQSSASPKQCPCSCTANYNDVTKDNIDQARQRIIKELTVNTEELSATVRRKISIPDSRQVAVATGATGVAILVSAGALLLILDIIEVFRYLFQLFGKVARP